MFSSSSLGIQHELLSVGTRVWRTTASWKDHRAKYWHNIQPGPQRQAAAPAETKALEPGLVAAQRQAWPVAAHIVRIYALVHQTLQG